MDDIEKVARAIKGVRIFARFNDWTSDHVHGYPIEICRWVGEFDQDCEIIARYPGRTESDGVAHLERHLNEERAKAAIAAMQPAPQWKWIGSAPRNGTCVLLWIPADDGWDAYIASGWYESGVFDNRWYAAIDENPLSPQPTHWMPLPTPPAGGSNAE